MLLRLAACAGALLVAGESWWRGVGRERVCWVDLAGAPESSGAILDLLRAQLERSGRGLLQCRPCPSCPSVDCRSGGLLEGLGWFFTGLLWGLLVASLPRGQAATASCEPRQCLPCRLTRGRSSWLLPQGAQWVLSALLAGEAGWC